MVTTEPTRRIAGREWPLPADVPAFAAVLTALVIGVVPAVVLVTGIHAAVVLAWALVAYGLVVLATRDVASGVAAAVPVLATVNADVPLRPGPNRTVDLDVVVADAAVLAAIALLAVIVWVRHAPRPSVRSLRRGVGFLGPPGLLLVAFAIWALIGAPFAAHDPVTAAVFGLVQLRYVVYFAVGAGLVTARVASIRQLSLALVVAVVGHSLFALAQFANGEPFGLPYLGETLDDTQLGFLWFDHPRGRYLGGLVGNNAAYGTVAVPAVGVLVWLAERAEARVRRVSIATIGVIGALCVPLSQYDSVLIAFATVLLGSVALATLPDWPAAVREPVVADRRRALAGVLAAAALATVAVLAVGAVAVFDLLPVVSSKNLETRLTDYANAVAVGLRNPVFGLGGGNAEQLASDVGFSDDIAVHSILFSYLAETGFVGAALWTGAIVASARTAVGLAWARGGRDLVGYLCVGAVGFLAIAMIDQIWDNHTSLGVFWLFAGAIVGAHRSELPRSGSGSRDRGGPVDDDPG